MTLARRHLRAVVAVPSGAWIATCSCGKRTKPCRNEELALQEVVLLCTGALHLTDTAAALAEEIGLTSPGQRPSRRAERLAAGHLPSGLAAGARTTFSVSLRLSGRLDDLGSGV